MVMGIFIRLTLLLVSLPDCCALRSGNETTALRSRDERKRHCCVCEMECYQRAKELLRRGSLEESYKLFTEFIENRKNLEGEERDPELVDAFNSRGHIRYLWVDFDEAVQDYTEAIRRDPLFAVAHYNRGQIHYRLGRGSNFILQTLLMPQNF